MFTSAECEAHAKEKLAAAPQHRRRLLTAAEAWLHLADKIKRAEQASHAEGEDRQGAFKEAALGRLS
jgi:hypothetical protein